VTQPSTHSVIVLNPATGHTATLVNGIDSPVGLAVSSDGQLLIADSTSGTVAIAPTC
jgi:sugar lactone lactonase YvrE